jgi:hypothetical protein
MEVFSKICIYLNPFPIRLMLNEMQSKACDYRDHNEQGVYKVMKMASLFYLAIILFCLITTTACVGGGKNGQC